MTTGSRIAAVETASAVAAPADAFVLDQEVPGDPEGAADDWWEEPAARPRRWPFLLAAGATTGLMIGWTALFIAANLPVLRSGPDLPQITALIRDWAVPVLLLAVVWLLALRNSRREAMRFGEAARLLGDESARLEHRLSTVNRELSLAREFIAAQARDIDTLGRVAGDRLSQHADRLASLISDNGTRIDAIADVSTAALDNMEKLRNQLPVIASSAKDVTNNIGAAGRTAHSQIEDLVAGFTKLNQFGQASERQVLSLKDTVETTLGELTRRLDVLAEQSEQRFAALDAGSAQLRTELDAHEVDALAAIRSRAATLQEELAAARAALDTSEADSITSLRARLTGLRDESTAMARSLRDAESGALTSWKAAIETLDTDLRKALDEISDLDRKALQAARNRLTELRDEAEELDRRLIERDQLFAAEIAKRQGEFDARHEHFVSSLTAQLAALDEAVGSHRAAQDDQLALLSSHAERIGAQLTAFGTQLGTLAEQGDTAQNRLAANVTEIENRLNGSQAALATADRAIVGLTDSAVRLLELIQASVDHSSNGLPAAMKISEERLDLIEGRFGTLTARSGEALAQGEALSQHADRSSASLAAAASLAADLRGALASDQAGQAARLEGLRTALLDVRAESQALAAHAQDELAQAIEALNTAAREAVAGIETMSAGAIAALAARVGDEGGQAIERALRERATAVIEDVEGAAAKATSASRDAAVQLREQLVKVNDLAGNLERRVAHARTRAEEQVDNDFARRVALITESLNSNAIDIARSMDHEVSDTAWAAYLKGDRGIFTRRAVRLLDTPEAKAVSQLYETDRAFRDHVSRYIADFEAMLRELLSTRDGHALGVTLLSSDMGKLYVALAQAIERLRA